MNIWDNFIQTVAFLKPGQTFNSAILLKSFVAIAGATFVWLILKIILPTLKRKGQKFDIIRNNETIFKSLGNALNISLVFVTGIYILRLVNISILEKLFQALMVLLMASPVANVTIVALRSFQKHVGDKTKTKVDDVVFDLLYRFAGVIIYALAIVLALDLLGINVVPFIAGAGIMGVAIGFAAKDTLSNLIAGVLLIIDRPFEIGDRIEVWSAPAGSATWGDVIDIGIRATKIKTTDNIVIVIPNNEIMKRDIINYTHITSKIRVRINIGIAYDADLARAKAITLDVADAIKWIAKNPKPKVVVRNFGESSVDLQLRVWIEDARKRMDTISEVTDKVKEAFDSNKIEIPYPKRDITITKREMH